LGKPYRCDNWVQFSLSPTVQFRMSLDTRTGRNGRHALVGLLRQSVFGRLAGYEDVNDAERLRMFLSHGIVAGVVTDNVPLALSVKKQL
jgi:hypothetical protein